MQEFEIRQGYRAYLLNTHCRELRNADPSASTADANRAWNARWVSCRQEPNGMVSLSANLPPETGLVVMKALELAAKSLQGAEGQTDTSDAFFARQADALVEMARSYLAGESADRKQSDNYQVVLRVDAAALCSERDSEAPQNLRSDLPVETMRRLTCDTSIVPVVMDGEGLPIDVGRKKRVISTSLGRAVAERDEECRFPGCCNTKGLERHHVKHWADGGETTLANLLMLCPYHHRMAHEGGYTVHKTVDGKRERKSARILAERRPGIR